MKIDNSVIIATLAEFYTLHSAADVHVIGFHIGNEVYFAEIPLDVILMHFAGISMTSDEIPAKRLRLKPLTKKTAILFESYSPRLLCSYETLTVEAQEQTAGNRGLMFEKLIARYYMGFQTAPNIPFWRAGDIIADDDNGEPFHIQAKFENATIVSEKHMKAFEMGAKWL